MKTLKSEVKKKALTDYIDKGSELISRHLINLLSKANTMRMSIR